MNKTHKIIKNNLLYYLIYISFIIEVSINLKSKYLWQDESFTFHIIQYNFIDIIKLTSQDVHPFLYYFIAKIFTYNIQNIFIKIFILRLISALPYLILLIIGNSYVKNNFSRLTSKLFMLCIISMPLLIDNIYQVRMYGWATLFVTIVYLLFIAAYKNNKLNTFIILSIFSLLSAYTHYYALIIVVILHLSFLVLFIINKKSIKFLIRSIIVDIIFYLPWLSILLRQTQNTINNFWTPNITIKNMIHMIIGNLSPVNHFSIFYILPIILFISLIMILINKNIDDISLVGVVTPFLLIFIGYIFSLIIGHSIITDRYITPSISIFWLAISIIIDRTNSKHKILRLLLICTILITGTISYTKNVVHVNKIANQFNSTLEVFNKIPKNSAIIYDNSVIMYSPSNYLNDNYIIPRHNTKKDLAFPIFKKVFNNVDETRGLNIPKNYKNIYYLKRDNFDICSSTLTEPFNDKYKINDKKQIGRIILPFDGNGTLYKIR